jgi:hypothetical protein
VNVTKYLQELKSVAKEMPLGPFRNGYLDDLSDALLELGRLLTMFLFWTLCMATYPVSVFVIAGLSLYSNTLSERAQKKADEEWMRGIHRFPEDK